MTKILPLSNLVKWVDARNKTLVSTNLLGINIEKYFMPSVANIIGTDLSSYKVINKFQFACNPMHVGRDEKMPIALYDKEEPSIVSPAYFVFEVIDSQIINPEYLMLWFKRPEFDREVWFHTDGSVRGGITWEEILEMTVPVPSIKDQLEIVNKYKNIENRISVLRQINDNLVETGKVVLNRLVGSIDLVSKTDIEINEVILPDGFTIKSIKEFCADMKSGSTPSRSNNLYWENGDIAWLKSGEVHNNITISTEEYITPLALKESSTKILPQNTVLMAMYGVTAGEVGYLAIPATTNQAICGMICKSKQESAFLYFTLLANQNSISRQATGGAQSNLSKEFIEKIKIVIPTQDILENNEFVFILDTIQTNTYEISSLINLQNIILGQLSSH